MARRGGEKRKMGRLMYPVLAREAVQLGQEKRVVRPARRVDKRCRSGWTAPVEASSPRREKNAGKLRSSGSRHGGSGFGCCSPASEAGDPAGRELGLTSRTPK